MSSRFFDEYLAIALMIFNMVHMYESVLFTVCFDLSKIFLISVYNESDAGSVSPRLDSDIADAIGLIMV